MRKSDPAEQGEDVFPNISWENWDYSTDWLQKAFERHTIFKDIHRLKVKRWKNYSVNINQKRGRMAIQILDKIYFKIKIVTSEKKKHFFNLPLKICLLILGEGGRGEREQERHLCDRKTSISCLLYAPWPGSNPQLRYVPEWGLNLQPFSDSATNQAPQPGQGKTFYKDKRVKLLERHNTYTCIWPNNREKITLAKTDRIQGRYRQFNNNRWKPHFQ